MSCKGLLQVTLQVCGGLCGGQGRGNLRLEVNEWGQGLLQVTLQERAGVEEGVCMALKRHFWGLGPRGGRAAEGREGRGWREDSGGEGEGRTGLPACCQGLLSFSLLVCMGDCAQGR